MKKILIIIFATAVFVSCRKEAAIEKEKDKTVIVQMEVVNTAGHSTFYIQQVVK